ncbi:MAG: HTH domain-containing protein [Halorientalis sp.]
MSVDSTTEPRVEFYVRDSLPEVAERRRDAVHERLRDLSRAGHVAALETETWRKTVPMDAPSLERDCYERFADWADRPGVRLTPFFDTRQCYSATTGRRGEHLVLPVLSLAVSRDGDLVSVYPHSTNDGARSVLDGLDALESARRPAAAGPAGDT